MITVMTKHFMFYILWISILILNTYYIIIIIIIILSLKLLFNAYGRELFINVQIIRIVQLTSV
jgi:hypothetical protein